MITSNYSPASLGYGLDLDGTALGYESGAKGFAVNKPLKDCAE
ncbi:MAG: hypothetical protein ACLQBD_28870 [Syntrophobacteraceae bacterium]